MVWALGHFQVRAARETMLPIAVQEHSNMTCRVCMCMNLGTCARVSWREGWMLSQYMVLKFHFGLKGKNSEPVHKF